MRVLSDPIDLATIPAPLQEVLRRCLERYSGPGFLCVPGGLGPLLVVEPGDSLEKIGDLAGLVLDPESDDFLPFEWVSDLGPCYEAYFAFTDDGAGQSIVIPKAADIDGRLLALAKTFATPSPSAS